MRDNDIVITFLIFIALIMILGGPLGLSFHGQIETTDLKTASAPGFFEVISWCWHGLGFLFGMLVFQVNGIPPWMNVAFIAVTLTLLWVILKWVRGQNTGV